MVATGDRDAFQLASERTTIIQPMKAGELAKIGPDAVMQRYRVKPAQVPDFIALRGDASDRIPRRRWRRLQDQTAAALLRKHGTLEKLLAADRFQGQAKQLRLYPSIATMGKSAPLPALRAQKPTWDRAATLARDWGLNKLADRLVAMDGEASTPARRAK